MTGDMRGMKQADCLALAVLLVGCAVALLLALAPFETPAAACKVSQVVRKGTPSGRGLAAVVSAVQIMRPFGQAGVDPLPFDTTPPFMVVGTPVLTWPRIPCAWDRLNDVRALRCPVRTVPPHIGDGQ